MKSELSETQTTLEIESHLNDFFESLNGNGSDCQYSEDNQDQHLSSRPRRTSRRAQPVRNFIFFFYFIKTFFQLFLYIFFLQRNHIFLFTGLMLCIKYDLILK